MAREAGGKGSREVKSSRYYPILGIILGSLFTANSLLAQEPLLHIPFERGFHALEGAPNPFAAAGNVRIVPKGRRGKSAKFEDHEGKSIAGRSALIIDGANVPQARGTVSLYVKTLDKSIWNDGKEYWLASLIASAGTSFKTLGEEGTSMAVVKEKDNTIALRVYQHYEDRLGLALNSKRRPSAIAPADAVPARIDCSGLTGKDWVHVRFSWDMEKGRALLGLGGETAKGKCEFRRQNFLALLIGTPPMVGSTKKKGFYGLVDEVRVYADTITSDRALGTKWPNAQKPMAAFKRDLPDATLFKGERLEPIEVQLKSHLDYMLKTQRTGGWAFTHSVPSDMRFLSSKVVVPNPRNYACYMKDGNSSRGAFHMAIAYEVLNDKRYLKAAERTGQMLLKIQQKEGWWPYGVLLKKDGSLKIEIWPDLTPIEDHIQSHPIILLMYLNRLTGKKEYMEAARKGLEFLLKAQNPNGGWAHYYHRAKKCGYHFGHYNGSEHNDYTTSDQMTLMLAMYRRTGDIKYLRSFMKAADWMVASFLESKNACGWAQQYDENNKPIRARHFEPAAISMDPATGAVPGMLLRAFEMTGDRKYLKPVRKYVTWLKKSKKYGGWYSYYDPETGKPIYSRRHKVYQIDESKPPAGGKLRAAHWGVIKAWEEFAQGVKKPAFGPFTRVFMEEELKKKEAWAISSYSRTFDKDYGTWTHDNGRNGLGSFVVSHRPMQCLAIIFRGLQLKGKIRKDHPLFNIPIGAWGMGNLFQFVVPDEYLFSAVSREEVKAAYDK